MSSHGRSNGVDVDSDALSTGSPHQSPWGHGESSTTKYDPADFVVPASDAKGHSERVFCRIQPGHDRMLDVLLRSRKFPYRTKGDVIRHAIVRHIKWLEAMEPVESVTAQVDAISETTRTADFQISFRNTYDAMTRVIQDFQSLGMTDEARKYLGDCKFHISKMPDGAWRDKYEQELDTKFGYLLEAPPQARRQKKAVANAE